MDEYWPELDLIDDPHRKCELCEIVYHGDFGGTCIICDIWICDNCWPEHKIEMKHE